MQEQESSLTTGHLDLLESLPVMILDLNGDGAVVFANKRAREGLGLGDGTLDLSIAQLLEPSNQEAVLSQIRELWSGEGDITSTWKLRTISGKVVQVDINAISIHENSYPVRVRLYLHDGSAPAAAPKAGGTQLTGSIEARAALKEEREYTKALIQKSGLLVYIFDTKGTVVEINKRMEDATGFNRKNAPTLEALLRGLYPDERYRKIVADVHRNMFKNQHLRETELKIATGRGETKHICWSTARLKNARGEVHGFIAAGYDVTEKTRLEHWAKLQASCLERISDGVIISDLKGDIIQWLGRAEALLGYEAQEVMGQPFTQLFPPEERRVVDRLIKEDIEKAGQWKSEVELQAKDGTYRMAQVEVVVVRNEGGQAIALVTLLRDRESDKESEETISELRRKVSDTSAQMAVYQARGDELEEKLEDERKRAENYLARADAMAAKNRDLEDEVARQAGGRAALEQAVNELSIFQLSLLGVGSVSIVTTDGSGTVTNWSRGAEEFTGLEVRNAMGRRLHDEVFQLEGYGWDEIVQETLDKGAFRGPVTLIKADGSKKPIILDTTVLNDEAGNAVGLTEIAVEFTGTEGASDLEIALFDARAKGLLGELTQGLMQDSGDTYRELEGQLARLLRYTDMLGEMVDLYRAGGDPTEIEDFAQSVDIYEVVQGSKRSGEEVRASAANLRNLSRDINRLTSSATTELELLSINEVAELALHLARGTVATRGALEKKLGKTGSLMGSLNEASRAVLHLLLAAGHALDAESGAGAIRVKTGADAGTVFVEVSHNGYPLGTEVQDILGDPSALVRMEQSSAVALGLAHRIALTMEGRLTVSEAQGREIYRLEFPSSDAGTAVNLSAYQGEKKGKRGSLTFFDPSPDGLSGFKRYFEDRYNLNLVRDPKKIANSGDAIILTGDKASAMLLAYETLDEAGQGKVIFLVADAVTPSERAAIRKTGRIVLDRPIALESLESIVLALKGR